MLRFRKGDIILSEGTPGDHVYRIMGGEVLICKSGPQSELSAVAKLEAGEILGEMFLFSENGQRTATAVAATDVLLQVISSKEELQSKLEALPTGVRSLMQSIGRRLQVATTQYSVARSQSQLKPVLLNKPIPSTALEEALELTLKDVLADIEASYTKLTPRKHK